MSRGRDGDVIAGAPNRGKATVSNISGGGERTPVVAPRDSPTTPASRSPI